LAYPQCSFDNEGKAYQWAAINSEITEEKFAVRKNLDKALVDLKKRRIRARSVCLHHSAWSKAPLRAINNLQNGCWRYARNAWDGSW
jgi:hypothetical protein